VRGDERLTPKRYRGTSTRRRRHSRAQAMVEFALVAPLFFTLLFGVVEFSLIHTAIDVVNFATKDAARLGSLLGRTDPTVDMQMVTEIRQRTAGIIVAHVTQIEVFKADVTGNPVISGGSIVEYVYDVNGNNIGTTSWPVNQRNDTLLNADYLGVRVSYTYTYLTGFIAGAGSTLALTATSVQRIEPQDYQGWYNAPQPSLTTVAMTAPMRAGPPGAPTTGMPQTTPWISSRRSGLEGIA
jgi:Flp pilus assembly protein TadG